jgi:hypothetical protein
VDVWAGYLSLEHLKSARATGMRASRQSPLAPLMAEAVRVRDRGASPREHECEFRSLRRSLMGARSTPSCRASSRVPTHPSGTPRLSRDSLCRPVSVLARPDDRGARGPRRGLPIPRLHVSTGRRDSPRENLARCSSSRDLAARCLATMSERASMRDQ